MAGTVPVAPQPSRPPMVRVNPEGRNTRLLSRIVLAGFNISTFAKRVGVSPVTVSRIVNGHSFPTAKTQRLFCEVLSADREMLGFARGMTPDEEAAEQRRQAERNAFASQIDRLNQLRGKGVHPDQTGQ